MSRPFRIVIAGGGTGGHIYPAIAIAQAIKAAQPQTEIHFVGSTRGLESQIIPKTGFPLHLIKVGRLNNNVSLLERLKTLFFMPFSFLQCLLILLKVRPQFALGVGGFASGPFVLIASFCRVPTALWEPNAYPGMANRILDRFVRKVFVVFPESAHYFKSKDVKAVGLPVRSQMKAEPHQTGTRPFRVLIFGGSQGSRAINKVVCEALTKDKTWYDDIEFVHQVGQFDMEWIEKEYAGLPSNVKYFRYLDDMEKRYAWADLVFCRGGISTISELAACARAGVIIPLPTAADNHQQKNAETLVKSNAAKMILQKDFTAETFKRTILELKGKPEFISEMEKNVKTFYRAKAAEEISNLIVKELQ